MAEGAGNIRADVGGVKALNDTPNPLKYINYIEKKTEKDFTMYDTYSVGPFVYRVQYPDGQTTHRLNWLGVFVYPPFIFSEIEEIPKEQDEGL